MMKMNTLFLTAALFAGAAVADTTLHFETDGQKSSKMYLTAGKAKTGDGETDVVFELAGNRFVIISHQDKTYLELGPKEIEALGNISNVIDSMIAEQMKGIPEAQREQMRGMIEGMVRSQMPKERVVSYTKTDKHKKVAGYDCQVVSRNSGRKTIGSFCVIDYRLLGIAQEEYQSISEMMKISEKMASQFGQNSNLNMSAIGDVIPIAYDMDGMRGQLKSVSHEKLDSDLFTVPNGYKKEQLPNELLGSK